MHALPDRLLRREWTCAPSTCGDGCVDPDSGEQCDFGTANNTPGSGCESNCMFSCTVSPNSCDDGNACNGVEACDSVTGPNGTSGQACAAGTPPLNGTPCGSGKYCENGACTTLTQTCGDGIVESPEQCDLGSANGTGQGCTSSCQFECQADGDCSDGNLCNGTETCAQATVMGETVQKCEAGSAAAQCTVCPTGFCNGVGQCDVSTCGDGCIDTSAGEQCDFGREQRGRLRLPAGLHVVLHQQPEQLRRSQRVQRPGELQRRHGPERDARPGLRLWDGASERLVVRYRDGVRERDVRDPPAGLR